MVDDDREIAYAIQKLLKNEGFDAVCAYNGIEAMEMLTSQKIDLIVMDVMMPKLDGISATIKIREKQNIPIIILSAKSEDSDKISGLQIGADDYVTKPFNPQELVARVRSQLRRFKVLGSNAPKSDRVVSIGGLSLNKDEKNIYVDGEAVHLTATEYKIMRFLMENKNRVFSAEEIYTKVWKEESFAVENTVMVHIRRIREKIEINPKEPKYLKVVWGIGYKIEG